MHDLSTSGTGTIKASTETQICIFCHTPHNADPAYPLWGHAVTPVDYYKHYTSVHLVSYTSEADAPPIDGISRLCLSCHDGTIALGAVIGNSKSAVRDCRNGRCFVNSEIRMSTRFMPSQAPGYLGTDLSGGHPISIVYDESLKNQRQTSYPDLTQLKWPVSDHDVKLYPTQGGFGVQCSSCHDPHGGNGAYFMRKADLNDVCCACHVCDLSATPPIVPPPLSH
jgi:predicted CXXCH cytochrome family protein